MEWLECDDKDHEIARLRRELNLRDGQIELLRAVKNRLDDEIARLRAELDATRAKLDGVLKALET